MQSSWFDLHRFICCFNYVCICLRDPEVTLIFTFHHWLWDCQIDHSMCTVNKSAILSLAPRSDPTVWQGAKPQVVCDCSQLPSTAASVRTQEPYTYSMRRTVQSLSKHPLMNSILNSWCNENICFQNTIRCKNMWQGIDSTSTASLNKAYTTHRYACWCWWTSAVMAKGLWWYAPLGKQEY